MKLHRMVVWAYYDFNTYLDDTTDKNGAPGDLTASQWYRPEMEIKSISITPHTGFNKDGIRVWVYYTEEVSDT